jgi:hypothetical protein
MIPIIIACLLLFAVYVGTKRLSGLQTLAVLVLVLAGIVLVIMPDLSTKIANVLGVGRGTDLLFYFALLGGFFIASNFYFRFKQQEQTLIHIVRHIAIDRAEHADADPERQV